MIFPMSGNNTFETLDFADPRIPLGNRESTPQLTSLVFHARNYCKKRIVTSCIATAFIMEIITAI